MIKELEIKRLFGRFNYNILFKDDKLSILTGPNGYGKSTILKIIDSFNNFNLDYFFTIDFEEIIITFSNIKFNITKCTQGIKINDVVFEKEKKVKRDQINEYLIYKKIFDYENITSLDKNVVEMYINDYYNKIRFEEIIRLNKNSKGKAKRKVMDVANDMKKFVEKTYFIKEQRLLKTKINNDKNEFINTIEQLPENFRNILSKLSEEYSQKSNKLDSTYPERLFATKEGINEEEYREKMIEMGNKFDKLKKYDISDKSVLTNLIFNSEHSKALKIYFEDFDEKYKVYQEYILLFDLYTEILNERLSFKKIKISKELGLIVHDVDNENKRIELSQLSSGEKQEIILFFELIFDTDTDTILLIDEPEISLHIAWQKKFIDDLLRILEKKNFRVILATHSPQIISNHWDRQIDLGELYVK
ncbi:AAA family ATPase [Clostridioides difficile]